MRYIWFLFLCMILFGCKGDKPERAVVSTPGRSMMQSHQLVLDNSKPISSGHQQTIYVFADTDVWRVVEPSFTSGVQRVFSTTEKETLFDIKLSEIDKIKQLRRFKNIVFICDIDSDKPVATYVKSIMTETAIENAREKKATMYMNNNLWANEQLVMFFMGESGGDLAEFLQQNQNMYFQILYNRLIARIMYQNRKTKPYEDAFFSGLPFKMSLPSNYKVYKKDLQSRFISYIWRSRTDPGRNPDKYISVYWESAGADPITREWLIDKRRRLAWVYYDEDEFSDDEVTSGVKDFKGGENWYIMGKWQNSKYYVGGVFQTFGYYDPIKKIAYLIDTSVYFPTGDKMIYLLELEGIAGGVR